MVKEKSKFVEEHPAPRAFPYIDVDGREVLDPTPLAPPVGYQKPVHIWDQLRQQMRAMALLAAQEGAESFEESDDFDIGDDYDPTSPWELPADQITVREFKMRVAADQEEAVRRSAAEETLSRKSATPPAGDDVNPPSDGPKPGK